MEMLASKTADELVTLHRCGIFNGSRQVRGVNTAQAAGSGVAGKLLVRVLLVPASNALDLARATALFEECLILGPFLLAHDAPAFRATGHA